MKNVIRRNLKSGQGARELEERLRLGVFHVVLNVASMDEWTEREVKFT